MRLQSVESLAFFKNKMKVPKAVLSNPGPTRMYANVCRDTQILCLGGSLQWCVPTIFHFIFYEFSIRMSLFEHISKRKYLWTLPSKRQLSFENWNQLIGAEIFCSIFPKIFSRIFTHMRGTDIRIKIINIFPFLFI